MGRAERGVEWVERERGRRDAFAISGGARSWKQQAGDGWQRKRCGPRHALNVERYRKSGNWKRRLAWNGSVQPTVHVDLNVT